jgi:2-keto-4-pentenoate hydratase/2-oxohepta-3-ene-1,7-dioic acid hydratase in catechol pathway
MKLASFRISSGVRSGVVIDDAIVDLAAVDPELSGPMERLIGGGPEVLDRVRAAAESGKGRKLLTEVELAPPVQPRKFFAIGLNYADHVAESGLPTPENLIVFSKAVSCVNGPFAAIERPVVSDKLDYEGELGFVIGRRCRHVTAANAREVIAGYLVVNDVSVRDWQMMTPQWNLGKSFDTHGPIGPWLTTSDEVADPHALGIRTWVNGELRQESNTEHLIFDCYRQVEVLSTVCTLEPGDVVATGTPSGVAAAREGQPWLVPGDRVRIEIEGLGAIENEVVQEPASAREVEAAQAVRAG